MKNPILRAVLLFSLVVAFGVLIYGGYIINKEKPPIPSKVVNDAGDIVTTGEDIIEGQNYYLSRGGQHIGTIWGHGSYFFVSVAFWNLIGAGVFGFLINPPIILYYAQGINTTPIHSHTALFGVYGMLAISLLLFSVRHIVRREAWSDKLLKWSFWGLNGGLAAMAVFSLIPSGFCQLWYAIKYGLWYARSPEIAAGTVIQTLSWIRIVPDIIFATGAILLFIFLVRAVRLSFCKARR